MCQDVQLLTPPHIKGQKGYPSRISFANAKSFNYKHILNCPITKIQAEFEKQEGKPARWQNPQ